MADANGTAEEPGANPAQEAEPTAPVEEEPAEVQADEYGEERLDLALVRRAQQSICKLRCSFFLWNPCSTDAAQAQIANGHPWARSYQLYCISACTRTLIEQSTMCTGQAAQHEPGPSVHAAL